MSAAPAVVPSLPMHEQDRPRIRAAVVHLAALIVCATALWALRRWRMPGLSGEIGGVLPLRGALYLLVFTPAVVAVLWRLFTIAAAGRPSAWAGWFVVGALLLGMGLGMHDTAAHLGALGRSAWPPRAAEACHFYDEKLGHLVFWLGFILTTAATGLAHLDNPVRVRLSWPACAGFALLGAPLAVVMMGNLMFERTGRDLAVIGIALGIVLTAHAAKRVELRRLPLLCMLYPAYLLAVGATLLYWAFRS